MAARYWAVRALLLVIAVTGCIVTRPPRLEERPRWYLAAPATYAASCVEAEAWIRKSGKTGLGLSLRLRSSRDCSFAVRDVRIVFGNGAIHARPLPEVKLPGRSQLYAWVPVTFDNDAMWNAGRTEAMVELDVVADGAPAAVWRIPVQQR